MEDTNTVKKVNPEIEISMDMARALLANLIGDLEFSGGNSELLIGLLAQ
jgi:hypothetical protein